MLAMHKPFLPKSTLKAKWSILAELGGAYGMRTSRACEKTHTHACRRILMRVSVLTQPHDKQPLGESGRGSVSCLRANHGHLMQTNKQPKQSDNLQLSLADNNRSRYNNVRQSKGIWNSSAYQQNDAGSCENIHTYLHASPLLATPRLDSSRLALSCMLSLGLGLQVK